MKKYLIILGVIILLLAVFSFIKLNPIIDVNPSHPLDRLDSSQPKDIVSSVENYVFATSTPVDEYANIRWGEEGTFRSKDVPAFGVSMTSDEGVSLYPQYKEITEILEKNSFIMNETNSSGTLEEPNEQNGNYSREDAGYQNKDTICKISISTSRNYDLSVNAYYLSFKCGVFDGSFEATQR